MGAGVFPIHLFNKYVYGVQQLIYIYVHGVRLISKFCITYYCTQWCLEDDFPCNITNKRLNWIRDVLWWKQKFNEVEFTWTNRESNRAADKMAKQQIPFDNSFYFHYYVPDSITLDLHNDYVTSHWLIKQTL